MGLRRKLLHVNSFIDRYGRPCFYLRVPGAEKSIALHKYGTPFSEPFMAAYQAGLAGTPIVAAAPGALGVTRSREGTVAWLVAEFLGSETFKNWKKDTRRTRKNIYERFREADGEKRIWQSDGKGGRLMVLKRVHVNAMIEKKAAKPWAQRNFIKALKSLFEWAEAQGKVPENPVLGVKEKKGLKSTGFKIWSEEQIALFEAKYPIGTLARLAFALLLYTGQRRSDVILMGRQHMVERKITRENKFRWWLVFEQGKTEGSKTEPLEIPMHPKLIEAIAACPSGHLTFLTTATGKPYHPNSFSRWISDLAAKAGVPARSPHGLRKACATRLADLGCSEKMIASITGHASLNEIVRYTRAANKRRLAAAAMTAMVAGFDGAPGEDDPVEGDPVEADAANVAPLAGRRG